MTRALFCPRFHLQICSRYHEDHESNPEFHYPKQHIKKFDESFVFKNVARGHVISQKTIA